MVDEMQTEKFVEENVQYHIRWRIYHKEQVTGIK